MHQAVKLFRDVHLRLRTSNVRVGADEVHAEISGVLVADSCSLDGTSMSRMLVSLLCAISGGWLKIFATSVRDCKAPTGLDDFAYTVGGRLVHKTDDWSPFGSCFVVGLKSFLTWIVLTFCRAALTMWFDCRLKQQLAKYTSCFALAGFPPPVYCRSERGRRSHRPSSHSYAVTVVTDSNLCNVAAIWRGCRT